jgi:hypothetical protein
MNSSEQKNKLDSIAILTWTRQWCQGELVKVSRFGSRVLRFIGKETRYPVIDSFFILQSMTILVSIEAALRE